MKKIISVCVAFILFTTASISAAEHHKAAIKSILSYKNPIPVKVVIVTMFEIGNDSGDRPGELQYWVERLPLLETLSFSQGKRSLRYNKEKQVLAISTGLGSINAAASIMALGMDPRFDLSHAYWLVAGVAGIDPEDGSTGSAVWTEWIVDGDLSLSVDPREMPSDWTTGYIPFNKKKPYEGPVDETQSRNTIRLNPGLVNWAYNLTQSLTLDDNERIKKQRLLFTGYPNAHKSPRVLKGDNVSSLRFWHGRYDNEWANRWVKYWTNGKGNFVTSAMEDSGTAQAIEFLSRAGKADMNRLLVLRTASDFTMQYPGITAAESLTSSDLYAAFIPSLEAAYKTGKVIVDNLLENWAKYKYQTPSVENNNSMSTDVMTH